MANKKEIVLVTGSSGCLGQHIIKLLQEMDNSINEIRLYDREEYVNKLGHKTNKKMIEFVSDLNNTDELLVAMDGVHCVIHAAAVIDIRLIPDVKAMEASNVDGTQYVIDACLKQNVRRLIFASSTDMVCGTEHIFYGTESTTPIPKSFMIGKYGETKCKAEELVLTANGRLCANGKTQLKTVALRPTPFFGEDDKHFFLQFLKYTKKAMGNYYKVRSLDERLQITYVGNVAWAFLKAKDKLGVDESIAGEAFFITDDTPIIDVHEHVQPFIETRGFSVSPYVIPYWFAWICLSIICFGIRLINLIVPLDLDIPSINVLNYMCSTFFYNRSKATLRLEYQPIYSPEEAQVRSLPYYKNVRLI